MSTECIFCKIVRGDAPAHTIWEDDRHLAFLSIFPNTPGFTVLITKEHHSSYILALESEVLHGLMSAAKQVATLLDDAFQDVGRTACILEGFGVNHAHVKLSPMHGTAGQWRPIKSNVDKFFPVYEGYISSHDHVRADDDWLASIAAQIKSVGTQLR